MTPDQMTLLRGLLLPNQDSGNLLMDWCSSIDLDVVDGATHRLLPMLFRGLANRNLEPSEMDRLRGVYRKSWYRNQQQVAAASTVAEVLDDVGIGHAVVGGLPLSLNAYDDLGSRMVQVSRVVVDSGAVADALDLITRRGFRVRRPARVHGFGLPTVLVAPSGVLLDLRDAVYGPGWANAGDAAIWQRRIPLDTEGLASTTLDATDTLVLAAAAAGATPQAWLAGVVDVAMLVCREESPVDWSQLSDRYGGTLLAVPVREALDQLADRVGVEIGAAAEEWRHRNRSTFKHRMGYLTHRNGRRAARLWPWYRQGRREIGDEGAPGFAAFVAAVYGVDSLGDGMRKIRRRIGSFRS